MFILYKHINFLTNIFIYTNPSHFPGLLGFQKRVLLWLCSDKTGGPRSPLNPSFQYCWFTIYFLFLFDFELNRFSLHFDLINIYRICKVCYECGFHFYFTFYVFISREIERIIQIQFNKNNKIIKNIHLLLFFVCIRF